MWNEVIEDLLYDIKREATSTVTSGKLASTEMRDYIEARARHLAGILAADEPGYREALRVERDNIALKAVITISDEITLNEQRLLGLIHGGLAAIVRLLVRLS